MVNEFGPSAQSYGQTTPVQQSRPPQNKPVQYNYPPSRGYLIIIILGIVLLMIGGIIYVSQGFLEAPDYNDDDYQDKYGEYQAAKRLIPTIGHIFEYIGLMLLTIGLIIGAIKDESLPANGRLGLLIAFGLIVGFKFMSVFFGYVTGSP